MIKLIAAAKSSSHGSIHWSKLPTKTKSYLPNNMETLEIGRNLRLLSQNSRSNGSMPLNLRRPETFCSELCSLLSSGITSACCSGTFSDKVWTFVLHSPSSTSRSISRMERTVLREPLTSGISLKPRISNGSPKVNNTPFSFPRFWLCFKLSALSLKNILILFKPWSAQEPPVLWLPWSTKSNFGYHLPPTKSSDKARLSISFRLMPTSSSGWALPYLRSQRYQPSSSSVSFICSGHSDGLFVLVSSSSLLACTLTLKLLKCRV